MIQADIHIHETKSWILRVQNIAKSFLVPKLPKPQSVLRDISFTLTSGDFLSIVGPNGCGKSTLLSIIGGFETADSGNVQISGSPIISFIFQDNALFPWKTVRENIEFPLKAHALNHNERMVRVAELMSSFGLRSEADKYPHQLSGGYKQRVTIARALAPKPDLLLMDEPFSALDLLTRRELQVMTRELYENSSLSIILVTHDIEEALFLSNRMLILSPAPTSVLQEIKVKLPSPRRSFTFHIPNFQQQIGLVLDKIRSWRISA